MLEKFKNLFFHKNEEEDAITIVKPIIITIHGYGRRRQHEFDNLVSWGAHDGYDIIQFDMYDVFDERDNDWMRWVSKAKEQVDSYKQSGRDIYLVGFSMGGVIASYLATICDVKKVVLLAPAFQYVNMDLITDVIMKSASSFMGNEKKEEIPIPSSFYSAFTSLIKHLKKHISTISCPVLILHGDMDEVISFKSSLYAFDKIPHDRKKLIVLHGGHHRLLMDERVNWECYQIMTLFFENKILHEDLIAQCEDCMDDLWKQYLALHPVETDETLSPRNSTTND